MNSLAQRQQDEAQDVAKIGSRQAFLADRGKKSFLGEISSLEISR